MLSVTFRYALISLVEIGDSSNGLQASVIAQRHQLSSRYLANVLSDLRRMGLVVSQKGRNGGYHLARSPETITLLDLQHGISGSRQSLNDCPVDAWIRQLEDRWLQELADTSLAQLLMELPHHSGVAAFSPAPDPAPAAAKATPPAQ